MPHHRRFPMDFRFRLALAGGLGIAALAIAGIAPLSASSQTPPGAQPAAAAGQPQRPRGPQPQVAKVVDLMQMMDALPDTAPAKPKQARKVLVLARAAGFVHSSIPLAARTIEALGQKTGAWTTVITYNAADINADNLARYDAVFLSHTTGQFLDEASDAVATKARRDALLAFVRGGKGIIAIHAATDSYHGAGPNGGSPLWPEWNQLVNGYFKWHWNFPTQITVKIEDAENPINAPFTS